MELTAGLADGEMQIEQFALTAAPISAGCNPQRHPAARIGRVIAPLSFRPVMQRIVGYRHAFGDDDQPKQP